MGARHRFATGFLVLTALCAAGCASTPSDPFDQERLEITEDLSESLANDLLELSIAVRDRQEDEIGRFFADSLAQGAPWPSEAEEPVQEIKWVYRHGWRPTDRKSTFIDAFMRTLAHFESIEDARFKVKRAEFDPARPGTGRARVKAFVIGRDGEGRREWLTAWMRLEVQRRGEDPWRVGALAVESVESKLAQKELFSEVALPAGVSALFPPFGVGANAGFVSHGAAVADVNGDGLLDLAATGVERNYLYLNLGDGRFRDLSADSLVGFAPVGSGALFLDYDADGDADLFFAAVGSQILLQNRWVEDRKIRFWDVSEEAGVAVPAVGFSAAGADVNGDGHTDIYVASYNHYGTVMPNAWGRATNGTPNRLFINQGDGTFRERAEAMGLADRRWSYAATFVDLDVDGDQDLYVANDFGENAFYRNDGARFSDVAEELGILDPGFGMGVSFGDYDVDGDLDLHVTNMSSTAGQRILGRLYPEQGEEQEALAKLAAGNSLYQNQGDGTFRDVTQESGGFAAGWAFGGGFVDFDNDGREDLYAPNGFISGKSIKDT